MRVTILSSDWTAIKSSTHNNGQNGSNNPHPTPHPTDGTMSAEEVAKAFVQHFYQTFDTNSDALAPLYQPASMLTFEGSQIQGTQPIMEKIKAIGPVKHVVKTLDVQPSSNPNAIICFVTGHISIGGDNPLHFCEMFQLVSTGPGAYYVHNDVFRLNYGL